MRTGYHFQASLQIAALRRTRPTSPGLRLNFESDAAAFQPRYRQASEEILCELVMLIPNDYISRSNSPVIRQF
jgi:hypothetical protein